MSGSQGNEGDEGDGDAHQIKASPELEGAAAETSGSSSSAGNAQPLWKVARGSRLAPGKVTAASGTSRRAAPEWPGKRTQTQGLSSSPVQRKPALRASGDMAPDSATAQAPAAGERATEIAAQATAGPGGTLPHIDQIQSSFGRHDVSMVQAHQGTAAQTGAARLGAEAFAVGDAVAFATPPNLHTAAHEAAHVIQQRSGLRPAGGIDTPGDDLEQQANAVADAAVSGKSAEALLDRMVGAAVTAEPGVQRTAVQRNAATDLIDAILPGVGDNLKHLGWDKLLGDLTDSIIRSPQYGELVFKEMWEDIKDHWVEFVQITAGLLAAEVGIGILLAVPDPTMGTKLAALVLQALIIAFMVYGAASAGTEAIKSADTWWTKCKQAKGNPAVVAEASLAFAHLVKHLVSGILALGGGFGALGRLGRGGKARNAPASEQPMTSGTPAAVEPKPPTTGRTPANASEAKPQEPQIESTSEVSDTSRAPNATGPGAAHVFDESFSTNRKYEGSTKHTGSDRVVGGRRISKEPTDGQAALDFSFLISENSSRRVGVDVSNNEFVIFDRTGNLIRDKKAVGGLYHGHVRTWDVLETSIRNILKKNNVVKKGKIAVEPTRWDAGD